MKKYLPMIALLLGLGTPAAMADYVTAHGTVGMLEMPLVTKTLEPVGTVKVWNGRRLQCDCRPGRNSLRHEQRLRLPGRHAGPASARAGRPA